MKMMPTSDLMLLIAETSPNLISKEALIRLFDTFGDDYFMEPGSDWELVNTNQRREEFLKRLTK